MGATISPRTVYLDIEKLASKKRRDPDAVRSRVHKFLEDLAAADLQSDLAADLNDRLRRMLMIASRRHRRAQVSIFKEAIDVLDGRGGLDDWDAVLEGLERQSGSVTGRNLSSRYQKFWAWLSVARPA